MIFPNISNSDSGCDYPLNVYEGGWTDVRPWLHPNEFGGARCGVVSICTATDQEIEDRMAEGEFSFDVIDEHMTRLWFRDRDGFRVAWRAARVICKGGRVSGVAAGEAVVIDRIDGGIECALIAEVSAKHIAEAA